MRIKVPPLPDVGPSRVHECLYPSPEEAEAPLDPSLLPKIHAALVPIYSLPFVTLPLKELHRLGGHRFGSASAFVEAVTTALLEAPSILAKVGIDADALASELRNRSAKSQTFYCLEKTFLALASLARSTALYEESEAISCAKNTLASAIGLLKHQHRQKTLPQPEITRLIDLLLQPTFLLTQRYGQPKRLEDQPGHKSLAELWQGALSFFARLPHREASRETVARPVPDPLDPQRIATDPNQSHPTDLVSRFLQESFLDERAPPMALPIPLLQRVKAIVLRHLGIFVRLTDPERRVLRAHQDQMVPELLEEAASGLGSNPNLAAESPLSQEALRHLAAITRAHGGVVKGFEDLYKKLDECLLFSTEETAEAIAEIDRALQEAFLTLPPSTWAVIANLFAEPIALRLSIENETEPEGLEAQTKKKETLSSALDNKELVTRFLTAIDEEVLLWT